MSYSKKLQMEEEFVSRYREAKVGDYNASNWHTFGEGIELPRSYLNSMFLTLDKLSREKMDPVNMAVAIQSLYSLTASSTNRIRFEDERYGLLFRMKDLNITHGLIVTALANPNFLGEFRSLALRQLLIELSGKGQRAKRTRKLIDDMTPAFEKAGFEDPHTGVLVAKQTADLLALTSDGVFGKVLNTNDEYHPAELFGHDIHRVLNFIEVMLDRLDTVTLSPSHFPDMVDYLTIALDHAGYLAQRQNMIPEVYTEKVEELSRDLFHATVKMACKPRYRQMRPLDDHIQDMLEQKIRMSDVTALRLITLYEADSHHKKLLEKHPDMQRFKQQDALTIIKTASKEKVVPQSELLALALKMKPDVNLSDTRFDRYKSRHLSATFDL